MGPRCSKLPRELLLWLWFRLLGARTGQVNVGSRVVIDKQASLAFFWPLSKKDPSTPCWSRERPWPEQLLRYVPVIIHHQHPSPSTLHPAPFAQHPWSKQNLNSPPPHRIASHRTTHSPPLPSTPLNSIHTQGPLTPIEESQHLGRSIIGVSIINCPRPPSSPLPTLDSLLPRTVAVPHPAGICIIRF